MSLSDRIRPNSEAAPWVVEEVKQLERELAALRESYAETPNGGPAFPVPDTVHPNGQVQYGFNGMTLRDYFAAAALTGFAASTFNVEPHNILARWSFQQADAMLAARKEAK